MTGLLLFAAWAAAQGLPSCGIVDAHTHTDFSGKAEETSGIPDTEERYLEEMRRAGVSAMVSHTDDSGVGWSESLAKVGTIFCAGVGDKIELKRIEAGLKSGRYRCLKVYLGYSHHYAYDRRYTPVYRLAEKYRVPVVFHTGDTYSTKAKLKYADPLTIDEVAVDHPKVDFVIAHLGNPWIASAAEVAYKNPNVYLEGSALLIGDPSEMPADKVEEFMVRPLRWAFGYAEDPRKLMFGTDWPLADVRGAAEAFARAIPREHWNAVFCDNARRVFRLP